VTDQVGQAVVVDASVLVDVLAGTELAVAASNRLGDVVMHAPSHLDVEVLSALSRLHRAGSLTSGHVASSLEALASAPVTRHALPGMLAGAWARRHELRLTDALYVELATHLDVPLLTTDARLARACPNAELVQPSETG
jgi:predicted nucleic acid-binding protein